MTSNSVFSAAAGAASAGAAGPATTAAAAGLDAVDLFEVVAQGLGFEDRQLDDRLRRGS